jgi:hypothetical protein
MAIIITLGMLIAAGSSSFSLITVSVARESLFTDWSYFLLLLLKVELNYYAFFVGN